MSEAPGELQQYAALVDKVDAFWRAAVERQPEAFRCREACASCCHQQLSVRPVEAAAIRAHLRGLPADRRRALAPRAGATHDACVFLRDDRCAIYPVRPLICRTHGLAIRVEGRVDHCPLNFEGVDPRPEGILDLEQINTLLMLVDRLFLEGRSAPPDTPRVELSELADALETATG